MGTLADILNAPFIVEIGGNDYNVRRLSLGEMFTCVQDGMRELDPDMRGMELQDATQAALESGKFPKQAIEKIIHAAMSDCNDGFDELDAKAIANPSNIELATDLVLYAGGLQDTVKKAKAAQVEEDHQCQSTGNS